MIIELTMARGWRIWIDGRSPKGEWELGEVEHNGHRVYSLMQQPKPELEVGDHWIDAVWFDVDEDDWSERKPTSAVVRVDGRQVKMRVTAVTWGDTNTGPVTVRLVNGQELELDEITAYVRLEG